MGGRARFTFLERLLVFRGGQELNVIFTYSQLVNYNVHLGGLEKDIKDTSYWFLFAKRNKFIFINLLPTLLILRRVLRVIEGVVFSRRKLLFVNNNLNMAPVTVNSALEAGEPYCVSTWIGGMLTNFKLLWLYFNKYLRYESWFDLTLPKARLKFSLQGFSLLTGPPGLIFINSLKWSKGAANEAHAVFIPVVGLVDTDSNSGDALYMIPANDDSYISVGFFNDLIGRASLICKYRMVRRILFRKRLRERGDVLKRLKRYYGNIKKERERLEIKHAKIRHLPPHEWYRLRGLRRKNPEVIVKEVFDNTLTRMYFSWIKRVVPDLVKKYRAKSRARFLERQQRRVEKRRRFQEKRAYYDFLYKLKKDLNLKSIKQLGFQKWEDFKKYQKEMGLDFSKTKKANNRIHGQQRSKPSLRANENNSLFFRY